MRKQIVPFSTLILLAGLALPTQSALGKSSREGDRLQDRIRVVGHIPLSDTTIARLVLTEHYGLDYVYAEHADGRDVTVMDVTDPSAPSVVSEIVYPAIGKANDLLAVAGTAALVTGAAPAYSKPGVRSVSIVSFADPAHPKVTREFTGVSAIGRDSARGLVFLANADGIWILQERFSDDPTLDKAYENYVLYYH